MKDILHLDSIEIKKVVEDTNSFLIEAELIDDIENCEFCQSTDLTNFGWTKETIADLPINGKKTTVKLSRRRHRCKTCDKTFSMATPHKYETRQLTARLAENIGEAVGSETLAQISERVGVARNTVRDVVSEWYERKNENLALGLPGNLKSFRTPKSLGIEAITAVKPSTLVSNVGNQSILNLLPCNDGDELEQYIDNNLNVDEVEFVVISPDTDYKTLAARKFPNAKILINQKYAQDLADCLLERVRFATKQDKKYKHLIPSKNEDSILHKRIKDLDESELSMVEAWELKLPILHAAYMVKERLYDLLDAKNKAETDEAHNKLLCSVSLNVASYFLPLLDLVKEWHQEIYASIEHKQHPRYIKLVNGVASEIEAMDRGHSFIAVWAVLLLGREKSTYGINGKYFLKDQ